SRDRRERSTRLREAIEDASRKFSLEQEEVDDLLRVDEAVPLSIHLERARRFQEGGRLRLVVGHRHVGGRDEERFHVEDARRLVRALEQSSETTEVPRLVV